MTTLDRILLRRADEQVAAVPRGLDCRWDSRGQAIRNPRSEPEEWRREWCLGGCGRKTNRRFSRSYCYTCWVLVKCGTPLDGLVKRRRAAGAG